jgi:hypothetical protein
LKKRSKKLLHVGVGVLGEGDAAAASDHAADSGEQAAEGAAEILEDYDQNKAENAGNDAVLQGGDAPCVAHKVACHGKSPVRIAETSGS